jgi:tetratricopeptide (TPR) repeat protein
MLRLARAILAAEIDVAGQDFDSAVRTIELARVIETDSIGYNEPEDWILPLRQVLGAMLLDAGRAPEAEIAYRGELEVHPENSWSLYGLHLALSAQGKTDEAAEALARFHRAWERADVQISSSRF